MTAIPGVPRGRHRHRQQRQSTTQFSPIRPGSGSTYLTLLTPARLTVHSLVSAPLIIFLPSSARLGKDLCHSAHLASQLCLDIDLSMPGLLILQTGIGSHVYGDAASREGGLSLITRPVSHRQLSLDIDVMSRVGINSHAVIRGRGQSERRTEPYMVTWPVNEDCAVEAVTSLYDRSIDDRVSSSVLGDGVRVWFWFWKDYDPGWIRV